MNTSNITVSPCLTRTIYFFRNCRLVWFYISQVTRKIYIYKSYYRSKDSCRDTAACPRCAPQAPHPRWDFHLYLALPLSSFAACIFGWGCGDAGTSLTPSVSNPTGTPNTTPSWGLCSAALLTCRGSRRCLGAARGCRGAAEVGMSSAFCYTYFYLISLIYCVVIYHMQISSN